MTDLEYLATTYTLRAPRVVVVYNEEPDWNSTTAIAIAAAAQVWGGSAFMIAPHKDGRIEPALFTAVRGYDPDFVVGLHLSVAQAESIQPGALRIQGENGENLAGEERLRALSGIAKQTLRDPTTDSARESLRDACAPFKRRYAGYDTSNIMERTHTLSEDSIAKPLTRVLSISPSPDLHLAVSTGLGGLHGLAAAMRCGLEAPLLPFKQPLPLADELARGLANYSLDPEGESTPPNELIRFPAASLSMDGSGLPTRWNLTGLGLISLSRVRADGSPTLVVLGSTPADFALAYCWARTTGPASWIPDEWRADEARELQAVRHVLQDLALGAKYQRRSVVFTSCSLGQTEVAALMTDLTRSPFRPLIDNSSGASTAEQSAAIVTLPPDELDWTSTGLLAFQDDFENPLTLPCTRDDSGSVSLVVPLPPLLPSGPAVRDVVDLSWIVEVSKEHHILPSGRSIQPQTLLVDVDKPWQEWVRVSRDGISVCSDSAGFVIAGTARVQTLARPRLRFPSLFAWVADRADQVGLVAEFSPPGRKVETLQRIWGGRESLVRDWSGPLRSAFLRFQPGGKMSSDAYASNEGVLLTNGEGVRDGYLTFEGFSAGLVGESDGAGLARESLDRLTQFGIVRRGVILNCSACSTVQFVGVDALSQVNVCFRCAAQSPFVRERWRMPHDEPNWYYDLHPIARELLRTDGGLALLAVSHLRQGAGFEAADLPELLLRAPGEARASAETDLVACIDGRILIGEVKSALKLGSVAQRNDRVSKLILVADVLSADEILLCSGAPGTWYEPDVRALLRGVRGNDWKGRPRPRVRLITGLSGNRTSDQIAS